MSDKPKYLPTIGLEIHAELKTLTKMFSNSKNDPDETRPNININPIDLGHPGTLPTINKKALEHMVRIGLAVGGKIADYTEFDRKNYFYPDIPKGYQISQYKYPVVTGGMINGFSITRIHLEEDTGLSKHEGDHSLVDYNRAGVPLMELVTDPVLHSAEDSVAFARELQLLLRYLGAGDANMEKGEMRVEPNISISAHHKKLGTKVEIKNLNSFKVVEKAINFEIKRMTALFEEGRGDEIVQETRGWDEAKEVTFSQRLKETSDDYRYFPEPDLPKMKLHEVFNLDKMRDELPQLPWEKREVYRTKLGLSDEATQVLINDMTLGAFFDEVISGVADDVADEVADTVKDDNFIKKCANYVTSDLVSLLNTGGSLPDAKHFKILIEMIVENKVSSRGAKDLLALLVKENRDPSKDPVTLAEENGLLQKSDVGDLEKIVKQIIDENKDAVAEYKGGKEASLQFLVGQGMRLSKGSANPQVLSEMLKKMI